MSYIDEIDEIQHWYKTQCNGDWEHSFGVSISTLDNPGWSLLVNLAEISSLENKVFKEVIIERTPHDWVHARVSERKYQATGGQNNLREMLRIFLDWARE